MKNVFLASAYYLEFHENYLSKCQTMRHYYFLTWCN